VGRAEHRPGGAGFGKVAAMAFSLFTYSGTKNLGDAIQTIALSRLLPAPLFGFDRTTGACAAPGELLIANGWLGNNRIPSPLSPECLFAGVFVACEHNYEWIRQSRHGVGARDPATFGGLQARSIAAELTGCATLTFGRYAGRRFGTYAADYFGDVPRTAIQVSHAIASDLAWPDQWTRALHVLELYRRAQLVYTGRLHVALPCLAFGTPVHIAAPRVGSETERRFSILETTLGVRYGAVNQIDVSSAARGYVEFLERALGLKLTPSSPKMPPAPADRAVASAQGGKAEGN
jgi:hypothetical protein